MNFSPYDKRCLGELASPSDLWKCKQGAERSHRPLLEGLYAVQVARWLRVFDSSQVSSRRMLQRDLVARGLCYSKSVFLCRSFLHGLSACLVGKVSFCGPPAVEPSMGGSR